MDSLRAKMSYLTPFQKKHKVTVVGSGNWGSTIAKVVAENTASHPDLFEREVQMWVFEEEVTLSKGSKHYDESSELSTKPQKLTHLINHFHENIKYLPGIPLPHNIIANPSVTDSVKDSTILIFNLPHQFIEGVCGQLRGHILPYARGISCIKGVNVKESSISLFSETIGRELDIYCGALSGANIANEVAQEKFSETTIAYDPPPMDSQNPTPATSAGPSPVSSHVDLTKLAHKEASGKKSKAKLKPMPQEYPAVDAHTLKSLFHRRYFHVRVVSDVAGVSLGGALKNIVALAAGFVDGLKWGDNAKAAIMRVGLLEMVDFGKKFFPKTVYTGTFTEESCGVADLITTCAGGRNHRCAKLSIERRVSIEEVEAKELNGQKLQGTLTTREVNKFLKSQGMEEEFPLFTAVYNILEGTASVNDLPDLIEPSSKYRVMDSEEPASAKMLNVESAAMQSRAAPSPPSLPTLSPVPPDQTTALPLPLNTSSSIPKANPSSILLPAHPLASSRYQRQALLPSISIRGQTAISATRVLIIGLGGLGSPASLYLAALGVHTLGLVDGDTVELSNLHRQIVHKESTVGTSKVHSAMSTLKELNSEVKLVAFEERFSTANAKRIVDEWRDDDDDGYGHGHEGGPSSDGGRREGGGRGWDIVLDCTDNPATRYLISDVCVLAGKVLVSGAAQRTEGQLMVLNYPARQTPLKDATGTAGTDKSADLREGREKGPCYRCIFPVPPAPETVQSCAEVGVLGPVVGVIGVLMAMEVVKIVVAVARDEDRRAWKPSLLLYSGLNKDARAVWRSVGLRGRRKDCIACGDEEVLKAKGKWEDGRVTWEALAEGRVDYEEFCGRVEDVRVLREENRVPAAQFLESMEREETRDWLMGKDKERPLVVDVREEAEFALGAKVRGSINVPISRILRHGGQGAIEDDGGIEQLLGPGELTNKHPLYFLCQRGNDSQIAAQQFLGRVGRNRWVGDVKDGLQALERQVYG